MRNYNKPTIYDEIIELEDIIADSPYSLTEEDEADEEIPA